jgi:fumarate hydratase class II
MRTDDGSNGAVRVEEDALGKVEVPLGHLWGAQTERSRHNFQSVWSAIVGAVR